MSSVKSNKSKFSGRSSISSFGGGSNDSYISAIGHQVVDKANQHIEFQNEVYQSLADSNEEYKKLTDQLYQAYNGQFKLNEEMKSSFQSQELAMKKLFEKYKKTKDKLKNYQTQETVEKNRGPSNNQKSQMSPSKFGLSDENINVQNNNQGKIGRDHEEDKKSINQILTQQNSEQERKIGYLEMQILDMQCQAKKASLLEDEITILKADLKSAQINQTIVMNNFNQQDNGANDQHARLELKSQNSRQEHPTTLFSDQRSKSAERYFSNDEHIQQVKELTAKNEQYERQNSKKKGRTDTEKLQSMKEQMAIVQEEQETHAQTLKNDILQMKMSKDTRIDQLLKQNKDLQEQFDQIKKQYVKPKGKPDKEKLDELRDQMKKAQVFNEDDAKQMKESITHLRISKDVKIDDLTKQLKQLREYTTKIQDRVKIREMDDYEIDDLGISQDFIKKFSHLEEFIYIDEYADGDLEWRPTYTSTSDLGTEYYQGQWIKGTMIKQGFGRRGVINMKEQSLRLNHFKEWFDQGYFVNGKMNGQTRSVKWSGGMDIQYYEGQVEEDLKNGRGFLKYENGEEYDGLWVKDSQK